LHYTDPEVEAAVRLIILDGGEMIPVTVEGKGTYLVSRHYIALHGLKAVEIDTLGFERVA
jgi:hypothetical protein